MIYITGSEGQLGQEIKQILGDRAIYLSRRELDLSNLSSLESFLKNTKINLLINTAAYTQVDKAEQENQLATAINTVAPELMARYSAHKKFKLIHFSTDYVFNGSRNIPYNENDSTNPINFYGTSKLDGELKVLKENPDSLIFRTSWLYSQFGKNFVKTISKAGAEKDSLRVVYDQIGSLTSASDLADVVLKSQDLSGIYHYSNEGVCSWYDVAIQIKKIRKFKAEITPVLSHEYPTIAARPHFSVLNKSKIKDALRIKIPHWTESLEICLQKQY